MLKVPVGSQLGPSPFSTLEKSMGAKYTVLQAAQPTTEQLAQLRGLNTKETEMGANLFTKNGESKEIKLFLRKQENIMEKKIYQHYL